jgi:CRISPR/Cas system-associated protein Cas10 (large subunit of type III CRISPR-Cas system)
VNFNFITPESRVDGKTLVEILDKLTGKKTALADGQPDCSFLDVLNAAGALGWELVQETKEEHTSGPMDADSTVFLFKRLAD